MEHRAKVGQEYETNSRHFATLLNALKAWRETRMAQSAECDDVITTIVASNDEIWAAVKSFERRQAA